MIMSSDSPCFNAQEVQNINFDMKTIVLLCAIAAFASAKPQLWSYGVSPLVYSHPLVHLYPGAPLNPDGTVADTPEVTAAKIAHFAAKNEALSRGKRWAPLNPDGTVADTPEVASAKIAHFTEVAKAGGAVPYVYAPQWYAAGAIPDTPEVTAAKIAHFAAHAKARGIVTPYLYAPYWYGAAPLNPDGTVADTPEVAVAKAAHFAEVARARSIVGPVHVGIADTPEVHAAKIAHFAAHNAALSRSKRWAPLNADGTVADTPEVAAAKAAHFAEVAKARGIVFAPSVTSVQQWWGPAAPLNPDGTVAETPEVRAAKAVHFAAHAGYTLPSLVHGYYSPINADGTVADTPEVVARKIEHFAAHGDALARLG